MKRWWAEIYIHPNKWYPDPDKKWAIETLCKDDEWCLLLDCDEEISTGLSDEILSLIHNGQYNIYSLKIEIFWLSWIINSYQNRLFIKNAVQLTDVIHHYIMPMSTNIGTIQHTLVNNDKKNIGHQLEMMEKK